MSARKPKIILVEPNADLLEMLVSGFSRRLDPQLTCVDSAANCLEVELSDPHDLIISELGLPGMGGIELTKQLVTLAAAERPIVLLADKASGKTVVHALRAGVADLFRKPFVLSELLDRSEELLGEYELRRKHAAKYHRMRELVRRVLRERRELNRRTEFICRDLVGAHRRLVHRVLASEEEQRICG